MQLGITPWSLQGLNARTLSAQAKQAEALGYDSFWLPEGHFQQNNSFSAPLLLLAACCAATTQIKLATTSLLLTIRDPITCAEQVATLDQLSEGRLILGVGRGFDKRMLDTFGVDSRQKRAIFERHLLAMIDALKGQAIGEHKLYLSPQPVQRPHPPIWASAFGPKALAQAGRLGLPYLASPFVKPNALRDNFKLYEQAFLEEHQKTPCTKAAMRIIFISEKRDRALALEKSFINRFPESEGCIISGTQNDAKHALSALKQQTDINYVILSHIKLLDMSEDEHRTCAQALIEIAQTI